MKPLLAHIYEPHRVTYPCYVQPKLNGIRALYKAGRFQSRDQLPFPEGLLDHLAKPLVEIFGAGVESPVLDGELYVHGWSLQRINAAVTPVRLQPTEDTVKVEYHVFDSVNFQLNFRDRCKEIALAIVRGLKETQIKAVYTHDAKDDADANEFYARCVRMGYEGMMYRLGDCPYTVPKQHQSKTWPGNGMTMDAGVKGGLRFLSDKNNRCWHLLKRKDWQDDEFECVGIEEGEGKLRGTLGSLICRTYNETITGYGSIPIELRFNVGSGLTDSERQHYWSNPPIGRLVKVKYLCLSDAGIPLNPTILCIL